MQISAISPVSAATATDHLGAQPKQAKTADPAGTNDAAAATQAKREFVPAPPLRPRIQDVVDIDRALISLRGP